MIALLTGQIASTQIHTLTLNVNNVGYEIHCPQSTLNRLVPNQQITLHIHTHVREDQITLYGFIDQETRDLFRLLISVSGVGPKIALAILSQNSPSSISEAISMAKLEIFTQTSGVGKKVAQKIILDLKSKIGSLNELNLNDSESNSDLTEALIALGYKPHELKPIIQKIPSEITELEHQIKFILKKL